MTIIQLHLLDNDSLEGKNILHDSSKIQACCYLLWWQQLKGCFRMSLIHPNMFSRRFMQVHVIWNITDWYAAWIWYLEPGGKNGSGFACYLRVLWKAAWKFVNRIIHHKLQTRACLPPQRESLQRRWVKLTWWHSW